MKTPKRTAITLSGLALTGGTALTLATAAPAGARTVATAPHHSAAVVAGCWDDCDDVWWDDDDWDDDWW
jgi:hypothetical protein